eukprot:10526603-Ditylum_brightwellii.AAC.1
MIPVLHAAWVLAPLVPQTTRYYISSVQLGFTKPTHICATPPPLQRVADYPGFDPHAMACVPPDST